MSSLITSNSIIQTLDLNDFFAMGKRKTDFLVNLKSALTNPGFFFLKNHSIDSSNLEEMRKESYAFFDLPMEVKKMYEDIAGNHQRGYTPPRLETGEFAKIPDEKEFFQIGKDKNIYVKEVPNFQAVYNRLMPQFDATSHVLLRTIALAYGLPEDTFSKKEGNSIMRLINYPETNNPLEDDNVAAEGGNITGMCASKHTDINALTLLFAQDKGLQLEEEGQWTEIQIDDPNLIIVNTGDTLQHITGGRCKSGVHRVVCQKNVRRFSVPYFCHFGEDESIIPLKVLGESDMSKFHYQKTGDYLKARIEQLGL